MIHRTTSYAALLCGTVLCAAPAFAGGLLGGGLPQAGGNISGSVGAQTHMGGLTDPAAQAARRAHSRTEAATRRAERAVNTSSDGVLGAGADSSATAGVGVSAAGQNASTSTGASASTQQLTGTTRDVRNGGEQAVNATTAAAGDRAGNTLASVPSEARADASIDAAATTSARGTSGERPHPAAKSDPQNR